MDPNEALTRARAAYGTYTETEDPKKASDAAEAIAEAYTALDGFLSRGGHVPAAWSAAAGPAVSFTAGQVAEWTGRTLTGEQLAALAETLPHSSLPQCVAEVAHALFGDSAED